MPSSAGKLRLVAGGKKEHVTFGRVRVEPSYEAAAPFSIDARVFEEDTFMVLSAEPTVRPNYEHPIRLMTGILEFQPRERGQVIVQAGTPLRLLAVVHDLERDPSTTGEWVKRAIEAVFAEADRRKLSAIAMPLLGNVHGQLGAKRTLEILAEVLTTHEPAVLTRIWLVVPRGSEDGVVTMLEDARA